MAIFFNVTASQGLGRNTETSEEWSDITNRAPQDFLVLPDQPWLDGFCMADGIILQSVRGDADRCRLPAGWTSQQAAAWARRSTTIPTISATGICATRAAASYTWPIR